MGDSMLIPGFSWIGVLGIKIWGIMV